MATVHIPAAMRRLTNNEAKVIVPGGTLAEVIDGMEERFPGLKARLVEGGKVRGGFQVFVNDQMPNTGLRTRLAPEDEVYFAPALAGGA